VALLRERGRLYSALTERLLLNAVRMDSGKPTVIRQPPKPLLQLIVRPLTRLRGCNGILPFSFRLFCFCRLGPLSFVLKPLPAVAFTAFRACNSQHSMRPSRALAVMRQALVSRSTAFVWGQSLGLFVYPLLATTTAPTQ
jgi:hypothetical protein